jgi:hypothetical protein
MGHEQYLLAGVVDIALGDSQAQQSAPQIASMTVEDL